MRAVPHLLFSSLTNRRQPVLPNVTPCTCQRSWSTLNSHTWLCYSTKVIHLLMLVLCQLSLETVLKCYCIYDMRYTWLRISLVTTIFHYTCRYSVCLECWFSDKYVLNLLNNCVFSLLINVKENTWKYISHLQDVAYFYLCCRVSTLIFIIMSSFFILEDNTVASIL